MPGTMPRSIGALRERVLSSPRSASNSLAGGKARNRPRARAVVHPPLGEQPDDRAALATANRVQRGVQAIFGAADAAWGTRFLSRLAAVRCAFRCVMSSISRSAMPGAPARAAKVRWRCVSAADAAEARLKRLGDANENGIAALHDQALQERIGVRALAQRAAAADRESGSWGEQPSAASIAQRRRGRAPGGTGSRFSTKLAEGV
jgi:hypothetical protein